MGTKIVLFGEMSCGLMKQKYNSLAIMTIVMFGGEMGTLASRRTPSQPWCTGVTASCCGGALLQELGHKCVFQMDNDPKHNSKVLSKWLKDNQVKWPSQSPGLNPIKNVWAELKKRVLARRPTNLTQLHQLCQEEWAKIHPTYCGKLVEGYPKCLTHVKQFKGNATKY